MKILRTFFFAISLALLLPFFVHAAAPLIEVTDPEDGGMIVPTSFNFYFGFDQDVTIGTGFITLHKASDDSVVDSWNVEEDVDAGGADVEFSLQVDLEYSTDYYINIDAGTFIGEEDDPFAGISDETTWNFTTRGPIGDPEFSFERVSVTDDEEEFSDQSNSHSAMTPDGRYVAFSLYISPQELYLRDREEGTTILISDNIVQNNLPLAISDDGRYVIFESGNDFAPGDSNGVKDLYLYDGTEETFEVVSVNEGGDGGDSQIQALDMSADGRYVAFLTNAELLPEVDGESNLYLRDRDLDTTTFITNEVGSYFDMTPDGAFLAIQLYTNIDVLDDNGDHDIYVYDVAEDSFELVSVTEDGLEAAGQTNFIAEISSSGRYVAFTSRALTLVDGVGDGSTDFLFLRDRQEDVTIVAAGENGSGIETASFADGEEYLAYSQSADDSYHIYRYAIETEEALLITEGADQGVLSVQSRYPQISGDGSIVSFNSYATNLVDDDTNGQADIFLWDESVQVEDDEEEEEPEDEEEDEDNDNSSGSSGGGGRRHTETLSNNTSDEAKIMELQLKLIELLKQLLLILLGQQ